MPADQPDPDPIASGPGSSSDDVSRETDGPAVPPLPPWLEPARPELTAYADLLATWGVERGLLGPREVPRLWERHLLNCAVVADPGVGLVPAGADVADVGSGAGLPGLVWALARPDLRVTLLEPLLRRATFLAEAVDTLGVGARVRVERVRAEDVARQPDTAARYDVVTARAVAPLERLAGWTLPLVRVGGALVALKGSSAGEELAVAELVLRRLGVTEVAVIGCGAGVVTPPTTVVRAVRGTRGSVPATPSRGRTSGRSR